MSNRAGMFSLDRPWAFPGWDNLKSSVPPWEHRGFWYHNGDGDYIVFIWTESLKSCGCCWGYSGHIYRYPTFLEAVKGLGIYSGSITDGKYAGGLIFFDRRNEIAISIGEQFPEPLPDNRW